MHTEQLTADHRYVTADHRHVPHWCHSGPSSAGGQQLQEISTCAHSWVVAIARHVAAYEEVWVKIPGQGGRSLINIVIVVHG